MCVVTNKSIFYHIPKTGGTWVKRAIKKSTRMNDDFVYRRPETNYDNIGDSIFWQHKLTSMYPLKKAHLTHWSVEDSEKEGLFSFSFVRRHVDWYRSWWVNKGYTVVRLKRWRTHIFDWAFDPNFEKFVENMINMFPQGALTTVYQCYLGRDGKALDFVGRQESLVDDLVTALNMAGEKFDEGAIRRMGKSNTSGSRNLSTDLPLSAGLEKKLNSREKWITNTFYR